MSVIDLATGNCQRLFGHDSSSPLVPGDHDVALDTRRALHPGVYSHGMLYIDPHDDNIIYLPVDTLSMVKREVDMSNSYTLSL